MGPGQSPLRPLYKYISPQSEYWDGLLVHLLCFLLVLVLLLLLNALTSPRATEWSRRLDSCTRCFRLILSSIIYLLYAEWVSAEPKCQNELHGLFLQTSELSEKP